MGSTLFDVEPVDDSSTLPLAAVRSNPVHALANDSMSSFVYVSAILPLRSLTLVPSSLSLTVIEISE